MKKIGKITLIGGANSMIYKPKDGDEVKKFREKFGWVNPDYRQSVVGDLNNAIARPEDFIPFMFRHISATIVGAGSWKATEFSDKVLKKAVHLIDNKPCYVNHEWEISNNVGTIGEGIFTPAFKASNGDLIPAGIDAPIWIDGKLHTDLCRKLSAYPVPAIQSVSVTIVYEWEPSHEFTNHEGTPDEWEFEYRIGTMVDGKMVRRVATEVIDIYESSFVWLGADPFAKILDENGDPINVEKSAVVGSEHFKKDPLMDHYKKTRHHFIVDECLKKQNVLDLKQHFVSQFAKREKENTDNNNNNNQNPEEMELKKILAQKLGISEAEVTEDIINKFTFVKTDDYTPMKANHDAFAKLKTDKETAEADLATAKTNLTKYSKLAKVEDLDTLETEVGLEAVVPMAKYGKGVIDANRKECERLYKLTVEAGKEDQAILDNIAKADEKLLASLITQYGGKVTTEFSGKCNECGSEKITYKQSAEDDENNGGGSNESMPSLAERTRY